MYGDGQEELARPELLAAVQVVVQRILQDPVEEVALFRFELALVELPRLLVEVHLPVQRRVRFLAALLAVVSHLGVSLRAIATTLSGA